MLQICEKHEHNIITKFGSDECQDCGYDGSIYDDIREWAQERGIYKKATPQTQFVKLMEEVGELARAMQDKDKYKAGAQADLSDALGDCVIVLTNLAVMYDLKIEWCIHGAYQEIKGRTGIMVGGTFVKDVPKEVIKDLEDEEK